MGEAAEQIVDLPEPKIRRYQTADIQKHAIWLFPRMARAFPHMSQQTQYTWLLNVLQNNNDLLPLFHEKGIAFFQSVSTLILPNSHIEELFVWVEDATDPEQMRAGAAFYKHVYEWATTRGLQTVMIENNTDISRKAILEVTGRRVFEAKQAFMRVRE